MKKYKGFLLVDVLFGMMIFLMIVGLLYPCYIQLIKTYVEVTNETFFRISQY